MSKKLTYKRMLLTLMLVALLTSACQNSFGPYTPESTASTPAATAELPPLPAPRLLTHAPERGEMQALDAPIELIFDQPMDQESVAAAFAISPTIEGDLSWRDAHVLEFQPLTALSRGADYRISVGESARNAEGLTLVDPLGFDFQTVGYLAVSEVQPIPDSEDIDLDTVFTVVFNRPIVPLTSIDRQADLPEPLSFDPPVLGRGEWLNTSIYQFHPSEPLLPATQYNAKIAAGLSDTTGALLADDYMWTFSTQMPKLLAWFPTTRAQHVDPQAPISVTFNQPMDHPSVEANFSLTLDDLPLPGTFEWLGGETPHSSETMVYYPDEPLPNATLVRASLTDQARAFQNENTLSKKQNWSFSVVKEPAIVSSSPRNGELNVHPSSSIHIEFASPMLVAGFMDYAQILPEPTEVYTYWSDFDTQVRLSFDMDPATVYEFSLSADTPDKYGARLGKSLNVRFTTGDLSPYFSLSTLGNLGVFNAYAESKVYVNYRNLSLLDASLYRLSTASFRRLFGSGGYSYQRDFRPDDDDLIRTWSVPLEAPRNTMRIWGLEMQDVGGEALPPGIYYLEVQAPEILAAYPDTSPSRYTFIRSRFNLTLKQTAAETLVWVTDLASGEPVSEVELSIYQQDSGQYDRGVTDADGLYTTNAPEEFSSWDNLFVFSGEVGESDFAVGFNDWDSGIRPWDFDLQSGFADQTQVGYLYTERPLYRPGQMVYFKGVLRDDDDAYYSVPQNIKEVSVKISDPQGKELYSKELALSDMGTFFGELQLDESAALGTYYISVDAPGEDFYLGTSFRLAEYRKPEFQVALQSDRDAYLNGEDIKASVDSTYYFGGPVADAKVSWQVLSNDYEFEAICPQGQSCPNYSWSDYTWSSDYDSYYSSYGRLLSEGQSRTDAQGHALFSISADIAESLSSQRFTLEATVTDINDQQVSNRTATIVHKGDFYVGLAPQGRIAEAGEEKLVDILCVDWDSQPVSKQPLTVVFMEHNWYSVRELGENGNYYWTWSTEDVPVYTTTVASDALGQVTAAFTPTRSGVYRVRALGEDDHGNEISSSTYMWVWGGGVARWRQESNNRIDLIVDRDTYKVGDVAEILIPSPYSSTVKALITVERGRIVETEVRELSSNSEVLLIPITAEHIPNIFVSVILVQGSASNPDALASFKMGEVLLPVSIEDKVLQIALTPDLEMDDGEYYHPRDTVTYAVQVTDNDGQPVETELSLRLADLAVLALADESGPSMLERFWSQRGLGVRTSLALANSMEAHNRDLAPQAKGGGGGGEADSFIRTSFADTAFWDPVVRTDVQGKAQVTVKLPDNLTTWRMQARGITMDTQVGRAEVDVLSTRELLVRAQLPRFFVVGDEAVIATIVHNNTAETQTAAVSISLEGLELDAPAQQNVEIPAGVKAKVIWPVRVLSGEEVKVVMEARAGDYYDGREDVLSVYRYSTAEVMGTAGRLSNPEVRQELVVLPSAFDPSQGELTIQVDGSLTAALQATLKYLKQYPYACVEQTISRFLPNVLTYQALKEMGIERPELEKTLEADVAKSLQRLYAEQHYDGGWGWWIKDESNVYLTSYALQAMLEAYRAGFSVDLEVMEQAVSYLRGQLYANAREVVSWRVNRRVYLLYVLAEYINLVPGEKEVGELGRAILLFDDREKLSVYGRATLAVTLGLLEPEEESRVNTLLSDLAGDALYSATGTHWEEAQPDYWNMNTDTRTSAIVLWAMARHNPQSELLPNAVRWLMNVRKEGHWETTQVSAWSSMALIAYMRASGELAGEFDYRVTLNGEVFLDGAVDRENIDESVLVQVEIAELLLEESNRLLIERAPAGEGQSGAGQLYYTAHLRYFLPADKVEALDRGIVVARKYSLVDDPETYIDAVQVGDLIRVELTLIAPQDLHYVLLEDPLPAGCEAVDTGLKTSSVVGERPELRNLTAEQETTWYRRYGWGSWWFSHTEIRDEKVALFATYLPRGTYLYTYLMRASVPGVYNVIPTSAYEMYFPEVFGRSDGMKFIIDGE